MKKESINPPPLPQKKKSKGRITAKSQEVKDIETAPLVSAPISKKKKQSSKSPLQDDQSRLENIIEKIIEIFSFIYDIIIKNSELYNQILKILNYFH